LVAGAATICHGRWLFFERPGFEAASADRMAGARSLEQRDLALRRRHFSAIGNSGLYV